MESVMKGKGKAKKKKVRKVIIIRAVMKGRNTIEA